MAKFTTRPKALVVEAYAPSPDTAVRTSEGVLFGVEPGTWYVAFPDGTRKILAHVEFIKLFEPADLEAEAYLAAVVGGA